VRQLNTHSKTMTASHNSILSKIELGQQFKLYTDNNILGENSYIFFCLNFG